MTRQQPNGIRATKHRSWGNYCIRAFGIVERADAFGGQHIRALCVVCDGRRYGVYSNGCTCPDNSNKERNTNGGGGCLLEDCIRSWDMHCRNVADLLHLQLGGFCDFDVVTTNNMISAFDHVVVANPEIGGLFQSAEQWHKESADDSRRDSIVTVAHDFTLQYCARNIFDSHDAEAVGGEDGGEHALQLVMPVFLQVERVARVSTVVIFRLGSGDHCHSTGFQHFPNERQIRRCHIRGNVLKHLKRKDPVERVAGKWLHSWVEDFKVKVSDMVGVKAIRNRLVADIYPGDGVKRLSQHRGSVPAPATVVQRVFVGASKPFGNKTINTLESVQPRPCRKRSLPCVCDWKRQIPGHTPNYTGS